MNPQMHRLPQLLEALPVPARLHAELPVRDAASIRTHRAALEAVLDGSDNRLLVITGPCSIHDPVAGLEYALLLADLSSALSPQLLIVMRAYLEKPRTVTGWRGLVHDPLLDHSSDFSEGLRRGRRFLLDAADTGLPLAAELLDPFVAPYLSDLLSWGSVGARTVASQPHRQLASGLPLPVGFKNALDGDVQVAVDAVRAAAFPQVFPGLDLGGRPVVLRSEGNRYGHIVLRGGSNGPNFDVLSVKSALGLLADAGLPERLIVDASHGNSGKDHRRQPQVVSDLAGRIAAGEPGLTGVMLESFLASGRQELGTTLKYGVSVTDSCVDWHTTVELLEMLADAVRAHRTVARH